MTSQQQQNYIQWVTGRQAKKSEAIATFALAYGQAIACDMETHKLHIVRSSQGSWMEKKLFRLVNAFNSTIGE